MPDVVLIDDPYNEESKLAEVYRQRREGNNTDE
jgi:hypothetical protein